MNMFSQTIQATFSKEHDKNHDECGSTLLLKQNLLQDTGMENRLKNLNLSGIGNSNGIGNKSSPPGSYIIPIVFHVITDPNNLTVAPSYSQIQMQLASLNAAFSNSLASLNNVPVGVHALNTMIQFCFAKKRWVNNIQTAWPTASVGVVYHSVTNSITTNIDITNNTSMATLAALTNAQYPPSMYLNVWCVPNISTSGNTNINAPPSVIGIGTFPWMTLPIDGIVMRNDCIGNNTYNNFPGNMFSYLDKGNILVHEAGHYLGLFHTFETITGSNISTVGGTVGCYGVTSPTAEGDLIFDTPPTMINGQIPPGNYNTCNESYFPYGTTASANVNDQLENFMSYSDDDYMNTFTNKQKERMWGALDNTWNTTFLNGQRANLASSTNLNQTGVNHTPACGPGLLNANFTYSLMTASITCSTTPVQFFQPILPGYLSTTTHTWYFGDGSNSTVVNPFHIYNTAPYNFTATLVVSDGSAITSSTLNINIPSGIPEIVSWSGKDHSVCRGTEQTILVKFPYSAQAAILTDGITNYMVASDYTINPGEEYSLPFTFIINNSGTWSLSLGSCNSSTAVASFTVADCCGNLVYNGDMESGPVGFTSQYILTSYYYGIGFAAIDYPFGLFVTPPYLNQTGRVFMVDAYGDDGCGVPSVNTLLLGQTITGLKPSVDYYISFKSNTSVDSNIFLCANKFRFKFYCSVSPNLLNTTVLPCNSPNLTQLMPGSYPRMQVHSFKITTPPSINPATTFSLELYEVENRRDDGFDYTLDNFIVSRMNGALDITPRTSTIMPCLTGSVQLNAISSCSNISNYNLIWQPPTGLSCSTCINPVATVSVTTIYTLIAIPPISTPPSPNAFITTTVYAVGPTMNIATTTLPPCHPTTYSLTALNAITATWQPGNTSSLSIIVSPSIAISYSVAGTVLYNQKTCLSSSVMILSADLKPSVMAVAEKSIICRGESVNIYGSGVSTYTWNTMQTTSVINVSPQQSTTYSLEGTAANGCLGKPSKVIVKVSSCYGLSNYDQDIGFFVVYPNPTMGEVFIETPLFPIAVILYDATGKKLIEKTFHENQPVIEMTTYSKGIYLLRIITDNATATEEIKIIKTD